MKVTIIGAGYVGCVTAACLAKRGHEVLVTDTSQAKVAELAAGSSPILEPGLSELVAAGVRAGSLRASLPSKEALLEPAVAIVCVSTPSLKAGGVDTRPLQRVFAELGKVLPERERPLVVIVRSTVAPDRLRRIGEALPPAAAAKMRLIVSPEFLRETTAIADFEKPPLILLGGDDREALDVAEALHAGIDAPVHRMSLSGALMVKYASNAYHALKIAFANEIAGIAEAMGADARQVMAVFAEDRVLNVSPAYLKPGFAFGGSCLPKDVRALVALGKELNQPVPMLRGVLDSNRQRIDRAVERIVASGVERVAIFGLSFKKGTDDLRESPYLVLAGELAARGIALSVFDPDLSAERLVGVNREYVADALPRLPELLAPTAAAALAGADGLVLCKRVLGRDELEKAAASVRHVFDLEYVL